MSRNQRFAFMSMARPFVPTMANPSGTIHDEARLQLIYCYPLTFFPSIALPLTIIMRDGVAYEVSVSNSVAYTITMMDR